MEGKTSKEEGYVLDIRWGRIFQSDRSSGNKGLRILSGKER